MRGFPSNGAKLQDYEAFLAIVDTGNLTQAAVRLRRSLQSVSRSLSALEAQLGVVLIRRSTRAAQPTDAGLAFHIRLSAAFREIALAEAELGETSQALSGTLRVAGSAYFVGHYVVPAIREFSVQHPGVKFDLRISEEFTEPVRTGVDLMIRIGNLPPSPMKSRKLASLRCVAIASPSYLAERGRLENPADLARHACIIRSSAQDARAWTFHARDGSPLRVIVKMGDVGALLVEEDGHRENLLTRRTAHAPNAHERVLAQVRHNLGPEGAIKARITEHGGHVHADGQEEPFHAGRFMEEHSLKLGNAPQPLGAYSVANPALDGSVSVVAEIKSVAAEHGV